MRGVLGKHRGGDGATAAKTGQRFVGHQRLAPENAVLIGERQSDDFELLLLDDPRDALGGVLLFVRP
jgi:hypothetical protein